MTLNSEWGRLQGLHSNISTPRWPALQQRPPGEYNSLLNSKHIPEDWYLLTDMIDTVNVHINKSRLKYTLPYLKYSLRLVVRKFTLNQKKEFIFPRNKFHLFLSHLTHSEMQISCNKSCMCVLTHTYKHTHIHTHTLKERSPSSFSCEATSYFLSRKSWNETSVAVSLSHLIWKIPFCHCSVRSPIWVQRETLVKRHVKTFHHSPQLLFRWKTWVVINKLCKIIFF